MEGKELQAVDVKVLAEAVNFHASVIVDKRVLLLRHGQHALIMQESNVANGLTDMELRVELETAPACSGKRRKGVRKYDFGESCMAYKIKVHARDWNNI